MMVREPIVAGRFYPADAERCRAEVRQRLDAAPPFANGGSRPIAGLVPHAGWMCSGAVAARVFRALSDAPAPQSIVLFGGVHCYRGRDAAIFAHGRWDTPLGPLEVDDRLAERILGQTNLIADDAYAHEEEHSLEVQLPFLRFLFPEARIVPLMVPAGKRSHEVGQAVGRTLSAYNYNAVIVGTTDLTHYGPHYGFVPHGVGAAANRWAKEVNDRGFLELVCSIQSEQVVDEAATKRNACSAGAVAATLAAAATLGATRGVLLDHTSSSEVLAGVRGEDFSDSVGYAGVLFLRDAAS